MVCSAEIRLKWEKGDEAAIALNLSLFMTVWTNLCSAHRLPVLDSGEATER